MRAGLSDPLGRTDEVDAIVVVLFNARRDRKNVRVKYDVFGWETDVLGQDPIGTGADFDLAIFGIGLAAFVKGHEDDCGTISTTKGRLLAELLFAFFHGDRIDDGLALDALQARLDHLPLRTIDHDRHAGDVRLCRNQVQVIDHRLFAVDKAFIHVDVDDLRAIFDLLAGDVQGRSVIRSRDQFAELGRPRHVCPFTHVHKWNVFG